MKSHEKNRHRTTIRSAGVIGAIAGLLATAAIVSSGPVAASSPSGAGTASARTAASPPDRPPTISRLTEGQKITAILPEDSAWTSTRRPGRVMRASDVLRVRKGSAETFLKFDISTLDGLEAESAYLQLWMMRGNRARNSLVVKQTSASWESRTVSHNNRPRSLRTRISGRPLSSDVGRWVNVQLVRTPRHVSGDKLALLLKSQRRDGRKVFARSGGKAPRLAVVTTPPGPGTVAPNEPVDPVGPGAPADPGTPGDPGTPPDPGAPADPGTPGDAGTPGGTGTPLKTDDSRVFAHYFPPYPISLDNRTPDNDYYSVNYLTIDGENGKHAAYGGLLRDRPARRSPVAGDWRLADMRTEVKQAKAAGVDGFTVDVLSLSGRLWDKIAILMQAADLEQEFQIIPMLDMTSMRNTTAEETAAALTTLYAHPSAHRIGEDYVLSSFCAECRSVDWWTELIRQLETSRDLPIKFIATFIGASDARLQAFAPISYGAGSWGSRNAVAAAAGSNFAAKAHALGLTWMQPVAMQDARPRSTAYAEAGNTETFRAMWARAIRDGADFVQIVTWNDYSESTSIAPSYAHGTVFSDLNRYYSDWFTTGVAPNITSDHLYVTHRTHKWDADPTSGIKNMRPILGASTVAPRDTAEALVFLTNPASVTLTSGSQTRTVTLPAGISTVLVPLGFGTTSSSINRGSQVVKSVISPYPVIESPIVQDMQYFAAGS